MCFKSFCSYNSKILTLVLLLAVRNISLAQTTKSRNAKVIRTLIVDGQNNHDQWPKITFMIKKYLEETGKFSVDVKRTRFTWNGTDLINKYIIPGVGGSQPTAKPQMDSTYILDFSKVDLVVCNFGWNAAPWPAISRTRFEQFIKKGGGLVVIHAADNSFPDWPAYNQMIGLGGWGDRNEKSGPYVYYDSTNKLVRDTLPGKGGSHGAQAEFQITIRDSTHPITRGMPTHWMHTKDELYDRLRGPAQNMEILATAFSSSANKGTNRNEPMLMTIRYGKGRIFHTPLGHVDYSAECVGFITCLQRGAQWAATGKVDIAIPGDFPSDKATSMRKFME
jgi:hypothetical protein